MQPRNIEKMSGDEILLILKTFGINLTTFLDVTTADICCRYTTYKKQEVKLNLEVYEHEIVNRFIDINMYYHELKLKYNGQYFIDRNITGYKIGEYQNELYSQLILTYNKKWP
jgi:hypothetical protein